MEGIIYHHGPKINRVSYNGYKEEWINPIDLRREFFDDLDIGYIQEIAEMFDIPFQIVTHSQRTSTCKEKAKITNLPLQCIIKGFYLKDNKNGCLYSLAIPGDKSYDPKKVSEAIKIPYEEGRITLAEENLLPMFIEKGTVHPFINAESLAKPDGKGSVNMILLDMNNFIKRTKENLEEKTLDDFSLTTHPKRGRDDHRTSIQMNYKDAYKILVSKFGNHMVKVKDIVND